MSDLSRLTRLVTLAVVSCAAMWAFAAGAFAMPSPSDPVAAVTPAYKPVLGDADKAPVAHGPAYAGGVVGDADKAPNAAQVQAVLDDLGRTAKPAPAQPVVDSTDDTGVIALVLAIAAMLTAIGAVTFTVVRTQRPVLRA